MKKDENKITITKKDLIEELAKRVGEKKIKTGYMVQQFLDILEEELLKENRIELRNFGIFEIKTRAKRVGRNPKTGKEVEIPERKVVTFKMGNNLKKGLWKEIKTSKKRRKK